MPGSPGDDLLLRHIPRIPRQQEENLPFMLLIQPHAEHLRNLVPVIRHSAKSQDRSKILCMGKFRLKMNRPDAKLNRGVNSCQTTI